MKSLLRTGTLLMFACMATLVCNAQTSSGTVTGHVVDPSQSVVVGAEVDLLNQQTGVVDDTATFQNANQSSNNPQLLGTFGQKNGAQNPRYMQLALRVSF